MTSLLSVVHSLYCHDAGVHDARPDRERDQAAMFRRITRGSNEISTENRVDPADHLKVILAMAAMPLPSRRPNEAERVDGEEIAPNATRAILRSFSRAMSSMMNLLSVRVPGPVGSLVA